MKLSEQLKQHHESGDFGDALAGYAERVEYMEELLWLSFYCESIGFGGSADVAKEYADKRLLKL